MGYGYKAAKRRANAGPPHWMNARYSGLCSKCGDEINRGDRIVWDAYNRSALCGKDECGPQRQRDYAAMKHDEDFISGAW